MRKLRENRHNRGCHLTSRIAHRAFYLDAGERDRFIDVMKRSAAFSGVWLLAWCVTTNHVHILVYVPEPEKLSGDDILARMRTLYRKSRFGNLSAVTNALGNATIYEYDPRGRKTYECGATYPVRYTYDVFGNKTTMMTYRNESLGPGSGDVTTWLYDEASGSMTNKVYADGKGPIYNYTPDGKLAQRIWARGIITDYSYDGWGNLTSTVYSDDTPTITLSYDAMGRQTKANDAAGVTTFRYDSNGSLTNETVIGVAGTNTIERYWDEFGRTAGYALNGDRQTTIGYCPATGRIESMLAIGSTNAFHWSYIPGSDLKAQLLYPNGLTASWQYDAAGQLLQICNATPTNVISLYDYTYDQAGRRIECHHSGAAFDTPDQICYNYNVRNELTNSVSSIDEAYSFAYNYDDIGNRLWSVENTNRTTYTANQLNQYTAIDEFYPQFDDDGNQTLVKTLTGVWYVSYNGENRPVVWSNEVNAVSMHFDRMGRRVEKNDERFVYNGYLQIANFESSVTNSQLFFWDPTESVATRPLVWNCDTSAAYYTHNGNKNVSEIIADNGELAAHYEYTPFGAVSVLLGTFAVKNPWRFSSEYVENETETIYYNYRHYEPAIGRWPQRDPIMDLSFNYEAIDGAIGDDSGDYMFAFNSPFLYLDIKGLELIQKSCECESVVIEGLEKANDALNKGKCKEWFEQHGHDYNSGSPNKTVVCHKYKLPCIAFPAWTIPFGRIGICSGKIDDSLVLASILIHELAHHYCTMFWGREDCAISAQDACAEEIR